MPASSLGRWVVAFTLASMAPLACYAFFAADAIGSDPVLQIWLVVTFLGLFATGVVAGFLRGVAATVAVWSAVTLAVAILAGPGCNGIDMSRGPHAMATVIIAAAECPIGQASYTNTSNWVLTAGMLATGVTAVAAVAGAGIRWIMASATPPA